MTPFRALLAKMGIPWRQPRTNAVPEAERDAYRTLTPEQALRERVRGSRGQ